MSIVCVAFSVTARILPFGLNATCAAPTPEPESARTDFGRFVNVPLPVMRRPWIVSAPWFTTKASGPCTSTLTGRSPTRCTSASSRRPDVMSKIDTSSLPALTASRWSPSAVIANDA